jgi:hypothetical protein
VILGATPGISDPLPVYDQNDYGRRCCRRVEDLGFASALQCRHPTRQPHYVVSRRWLS